MNNMDDEKQKKLNRDFFNALLNSNFSLAKTLLDSVDISYNHNYCFNYFIYTKLINQLDFLLEAGLDPYYDNHKAMELAITRNFTPVIEFFLEKKLISYEYIINMLDRFKEDPKSFKTFSSFNNPNIYLITPLYDWAVIRQKHIDLKNNLDSNLKKPLDKSNNKTKI